jgi:hypothetical protein
MDVDLIDLITTATQPTAKTRIRFPLALHAQAAGTTHNSSYLLHEPCLLAVRVYCTYRTTNELCVRVALDGHDA